MIETIAAAVTCVALNIYHEARGEPEQGKAAVAHVTLNRGRRARKPVCHTVAEHRQFSWAHGRFQANNTGVYLREDAFPKDGPAWRDALRVARGAVLGAIPDPTGGALFFHVFQGPSAVEPAWRLAMLPVVEIGNHRFYRRPS